MTAAQEQACIALCFVKGDFWAVAKQIVTTELVPWALGFRDPVRERVDLRQRGAPG